MPSAPSRRSSRNAASASTKQMEILGAQVRSLGDDLESARRESETDPLTRVPNRKAFDDYLARSVEMHKAFGQAMSMLIVDVDHFKTVNDSNGHATGDGVLRTWPTAW